jgi:hypothetical protein
VTRARYPVGRSRRDAATVTTLETRRRETGTAGGPTVRAAIDAFLNTPRIKGNPNTLHAYAGVLDWVADRLDADRVVADVADAEIGDALTELWGEAKAATWNRNRAAVSSWLAWCADKKNWVAPALPATAGKRRRHRLVQAQRDHRSAVNELRNPSIVA